MKWTLAHIEKLKAEGKIRDFTISMLSNSTTLVNGKIKYYTTMTKKITKEYRYIIGIDTGVNTGFSLWDTKYKTFQCIETVSIHRALEKVKGFSDGGLNVFVRVEDARKRKWFGKAGKEQLQGAGSIKRDAKIWEDFLTDLKVDFEMVSPKNNKTKLNAATFIKITNWEGRTTEHSRDAAMLVFGY